MSMRSLTTKDGICEAFKNLCLTLFQNNTPADMTHLLVLCSSLFILNSVKPIRSLYDQCMSHISQNSLNTYYNTINKEGLTDGWKNTIVKWALSAIPKEFPNAPILITIDDTIIPKYGENFEDVAVIFDHCARNGSNYLNGHCFVGILLSVPVLINYQLRYVKIPIEYNLSVPAKERSEDDKNKLQMACDMITNLLSIMTPEQARRSVILCDAWYSKAPITEMRNCDGNHFDMVCAVRKDTVCRSLEIEQPKLGRKRIYGDRIEVDDLPMMAIPGENYQICSFQATTNIFKGRVVTVYVTKPKNGNGAEQLFICTNPDLFSKLDLSFLPKKETRDFYGSHPELLGYVAYKFRWHLETVFYEQKTFWGLGDYRMRSRTGFMNFVNLICTMYALTSLLPFLDPKFADLQTCSIQQRRFWVGKQINRELILRDFVTYVENLNNSEPIAISLQNYCNSNAVNW